MDSVFYMSLGAAGVVGLVILRLAATHGWAWVEAKIEAKVTAAEADLKAKFAAAAAPFEARVATPSASTGRKDDCAAPHRQGDPAINVRQSRLSRPTPSAFPVTR